MFGLLLLFGEFGSNGSSAEFIPVIAFSFDFSSNFNLSLVIVNFGSSFDTRAVE